MPRFRQFVDPVNRSILPRNIYIYKNVEYSRGMNKYNKNSYDAYWLLVKSPSCSLMDVIFRSIGGNGAGLNIETLEGNCTARDIVAAVKEARSCIESGQS